MKCCTNVKPGAPVLRFLVSISIALLWFLFDLESSCANIANELLAQAVNEQK
jgi:hypothetical protein